MNQLWFTMMWYELHPLLEAVMFYLFGESSKAVTNLTTVEKLSGSISEAKEINEKENTEHINNVIWKTSFVPAIDCCSKLRLLEGC